ncbi:MAG TPA: LppP/LprE family lipoprotein [Streptosporangiaceae bacterium]|jgi:hypothetical protein
MASRSRRTNGPYGRFTRTGTAAVALVAAAVGVAGCGRAAAYQAADGSARTAAPTIGQVRGELAKMGYTLYRPTTVPPGPLRAFRGIWHSAGDGAVQNVFFYDGTRFVGVAHDPNFRSAVIEAQDGAKVTVRQYLYRPSDPNCCPGGGTRDYVFTWSDGHLNVRTGGAAHAAPTTPPATPDPV